MDVSFDSAKKMITNWYNCLECISMTHHYFSDSFRSTIDTLITEQIFVDKPNAVDVMLEIVKIK